ncbi:MAG TPA: hypothetical protein VFG59_06615 [Anaeromyxobacter sp.]|nr:hypothetical protein [Anaeromyxobacter sp.]
MHSRLRISLPLAAIVAISACSAATTQDAGPGGGGAQQVAVTISPSSTEVRPSGTAQFDSTVTGSADTSVVWAVVEAAGGSVTDTGLYTAPGSTGTFHVKVSSQAAPASSAVATVTVTAAPAVQVTLSPGTVTVAAGGSQTFTATVANATDTRVTWSVSEATGCGSVTQAGVYTAPGAAATCHVVATSVADPTRSATATVTVSAPPPPVTLTLSPASGAVDACKTLTFAATVTGASDTSVNWSVSEGATGGTITSAGVYTAPSTAGTYHVVAASRASPSTTKTATVTVSDHVLSVSVSPATATVTAGGTAQFSATVTTSCGTFAATVAAN